MQKKRDFQAQAIHTPNRQDSNPAVCGGLKPIVIRGTFLLDGQ
jgi:hypothetical protein